MTPKQALKELRRRAKTNAQLAKWANRTRQAVSAWTKVPPECVLTLEAATGMSRHDIRGDIYPRESP